MNLGTLLGRPDPLPVFRRVCHEAGVSPYDLAQELVRVEWRPQDIGAEDALRAVAACTMPGSAPPLLPHRGPIWDLADRAIEAERREKAAERRAQEATARAFRRQREVAREADRQAPRWTTRGRDHGGAPTLASLGRPQRPRRLRS